MTQYIEIEEVMLSQHCILFCHTCETWTNHRLSRMGDFYACSCGSIVEVDLIIEEEIEQ